LSRNPLQAQIDLARRDAERAGHRHAQLCVAAAAVPILTHFPTAAAVIIGVDDWAVRQRGARILAVLSSLGTLLWVFTPDDTADRADLLVPATAAPGNVGRAAQWDQLCAEAEDLLSQAVRHTSPELMQWRPEAGDAADESDADAFIVELFTGLAVPDYRAAQSDEVQKDDPILALQCDVKVDITARRWVVRCTVHLTQDGVDADDPETAARHFCCDRGRRWVFLVHRTIHKETEGLRDLSLTELVAEIRYWLEDDRAGGFALGSAAAEVLTVRRYLYGYAEHIPLDVNIKALSPSAALVRVADMDCPGVPPQELIGCDAYASDGVTYLYTVIDLGEPSP
jgi:hypothetical protein